MSGSAGDAVRAPTEETVGNVLECADGFRWMEADGGGGWGRAPSDRAYPRAPPLNIMNLSLRAGYGFAGIAAIVLARRRLPLRQDVFVGCHCHVGCHCGHAMRHSSCVQDVMSRLLLEVFFLSICCMSVQESMASQSQCQSALLWWVVLAMSKNSSKLDAQSET